MNYHLSLRVLKEGRGNLYKTIPAEAGIQQGKGLVSKVLSFCHPERSEGSGGGGMNVNSTPLHPDSSSFSPAKELVRRAGRFSEWLL